MSSGSAVGSAKEGARKASNSDALERTARVGYAVNGLLHILIGVIAVRLAVGSSSDSADQSGALGQIAAQPFGRVVLWVGVLGFVALGVWQLAEMVVGGKGGDGSDRAKHATKAGGKGLVYLALAFTTFSFARGGSTSSSEQSTDITADLMTSSAGRVVVALVGVGLVGVGVYHVVKGAKKKFLADLSSTGGGGDVGRAVVRLGQFGYIAKGIALGVVGLLFVLAAVQADPEEATGLDGALKTLGEQPGGPVILVLVGLGFVAFGLYSFARARYARM